MSWTRKAWFAGAAAAAVVLIAFLFALQPSSIAWSQVVEAVRTLPWVHMKVVGDGGQSRESWNSFPRNIGVMHDSEMVRYDDYRSGVRYQYDLPKKKLYRLSTAQAEDFTSAEGLFQAIFHGNTIREGDYFPGLRIVKQRQWTVDNQASDGSCMNWS